MADITEQRLAALTSIPLADSGKAAILLQKQRATAQDFGPAFARLSVTDTAGAARFSRAFVGSLETRDQAAQFFDEVARAHPADRLVILGANRDASGGRAVVSGISLLAEAPAAVVMKDFLLPGGVRDDTAFESTMQWLAEAGAELTKRGIPLPPADLEHDGILDDIGDFLSDVADAVT